MPGSHGQDLLVTALDHCPFPTGWNAFLYSLRSPGYDHCPERVPFSAGHRGSYLFSACMGARCDRSRSSWATAVSVIHWSPQLASKASRTLDSRSQTTSIIVDELCLKSFREIIFRNKVNMSIQRKRGASTVPLENTSQ